jgi:protoporphyrinogen/coproporphyrinogen III oxidase
MSQPGRHVVVVGGGITGLVTAYRLLTGPGAPGRNGRSVEVTVLEADEVVGGKLRTIEVAGIPVEAGADSFVVRKPEAVELCKELGLGDELVTPGADGAFVWTRGSLVPFPERSAFGIPSTVRGMLAWPGLPVGSRLRAAADAILPRGRSEADESLGTLVRRRMGRRASDTLVGPLLAGIQAAAPERMSVLATFPELKEWERRHGSLIRGARGALRAARGGKAREGRSKPATPAALFAAPWNGVSDLVGSLEKWIDPARIQTEAPATAIQREASGYVVDAAGHALPADAVVLATPAFESARLLAGLNEDAAAELASIPYASTAVVILVYPRGTGGRLPAGTGFVAPVGDRTITACTWVSRKWPRPEYEDRAVIRCFVGRAGGEELVQLPDDSLADRVVADVEAATPVGVDPEAVRIWRWRRSMPQYEVGHLERVARIEGTLAATPGVVVAGASLRGVGIPDCIRDAGRAAHQVEALLEVAAPDGDTG